MVAESWQRDRNQLQTLGNAERNCLSVVALIAMTFIVACSEPLSVGHQQEAIIECNGNSVGQACDSDDDPCTQEVCVQLGQDVQCQLQQFAPDGTACLSDGQACTADLCQSGTCQHTRLESGTLCDDGLFCTTGDSCDDSGVCAGAVFTCDDGNECTSNRCDETINECLADVLVGLDCGATSDACTQVGFCDGVGVCIGTSTIDCNDGNSCTIDQCNDVGTSCSHIVDSGSVCDDDNECTEIDSCGVGGQCVGVAVADGTSCGSIGSCLVAQTCQGGNCLDAGPKPDQTVCDDADMCTEIDRCDDGACIGNLISCDDDDPCTTDSCDSMAGCVHTLIDACLFSPDAGSDVDRDASLGSDGSTHSVLGGGGCHVGGTSTSRPSLVLILLLAVWAFRRRREVLGALVLLSSQVYLSQVAFADGFDSELFKPSTSSTSFFSQSDAAVLQSGTFNFGVGLNSSFSPLVLYDSDSGDKLAGGDVVSRRDGGYFTAGIGLRNRYELGVALPIVLRQLRGDAMLPNNPNVSSASLGDLRLDVKMRLWHSGGITLSTMASTVLPIGDDESLLGEGGASITPRLLTGYRRGALRVAANVGLRLRPESEVASLQIDDEVTGGLGLDVEVISEKLWLLSEIYGSRGIHADRAESFPAEAVVGARFGVSGPWQVQAGGGFGIGRGYGTPAFRGLIALFYAPKSKSISRLSRWTPEAVVVFAVAPKEKKTAAAKDSDGDGIDDSADACINEAEDFDNFEDTDGCPDPDNDNDRIVDVDDQCPLRAEVINGVDDGDGCPDEGIITLKLGRVVLEETVLFDKNRARVKRKGKRALRAIVSLYQQHPEWRGLRIEGHSDSRGPRDYNLDLSRRRAERVRQEMVELGMDPTQISSEGFGEKQLLRRGRGQRIQQINRRVEFVIETPQSTELEP